MHNKNNSGKERLEARLSIRLTEAECGQFSSFCQENGVTQRDGLLMLLSQYDSDGNILSRRIQRQSDQILAQRHELVSLRTRKQEGSSDEKTSKKLLEYIHFYDKGLHQYASYVTDGLVIPQPLKCYSWNQFHASHGNFRDYEYPDEDCFVPVLVQHLCYGKGSPAAVFLMGFNLSTGQKIRFRFYDRREYIGPHPVHSGQFFDGGCFLLGGKRAKDGACDLYFALQFPFCGERKDESERHVPQGRVEDILADATNRSG